jgi:hypothetical protein
MENPEKFEDTMPRVAKTWQDKVKDMLRDNQKVYLIFAGVAVISIGIATAFIFNKVDEEADDEIVSAQEEQRILTEIIRNNPSVLIEDEVTEDVTDSTSSGKQQPAVEQPSNPSDPSDRATVPVPEIPETGPIGDIYDDLISPDINVYNYRHTTIVTEPGLAANVCPVLYYVPDDTTVSEYYEYFDLNRSYYKDEITQDGELSYYNLSKYGNTESEYLTYQGGTIAAKLLFDIDPNYSNEWQMEPVSYPSYPDSYPVSYPEPNILDFFGPNAAITDMEEIDGVIYYDVTSYYYSSCYFYDDNTPQRKFITIYKVDSRDYSIVERKRFIDVIHESTLISTTTTESERDKVNYEQVAEHFSFNYEADILDVNYRDYIYDADVEFAMDMNYLDENNQDLIFPDLDQHQLMYIYGKEFPEKVVNDNYYYTREFYANTERGEQEYLDTMYYYRQRPLIGMGFDTYSDYEYNSIAIYDQNMSLDEIIALKSSYNFNSNTEYIDTQVNINGTYRPAKEIKITYYVTYPYPISYPVSYMVSYPVSYPASYGISYPVSYPDGYTYAYTTTHLVFYNDDQVVTMTNYGYSDEYLLNQNYTAAQLGEPAFEQMQAAIYQEYNWYESWCCYY